MNDIIAIKQDDRPIYNIVLKDNYNFLYKELNLLDIKNQKICIVTDSNVSKLYLNELMEILKDFAKVVESFTFFAGEENKNLNTVSKLYEKLIESNFDRKDILIALGGGVVGDLTGYAAATYLRGIRFLQMPTSLLSMVDSSIGGKTGVDFNAYKNMIGAFHQPKSVYMNLKTLLSLDEKQYYNGFGEIIKHGLIKDHSYYEWMKNNCDKIKIRDMETLKELVYRSCMIKKEVVEKDPKELGDRALLNFGHTIGHAIEKLMEFTLLHGECVSLGMVAASYLTYLRGHITMDELDDIKNTLKMFHLPITVSGLNAEDILEVCFHDKKVEGSKIKFILLNAIGDSRIDTTVTREEMIQAIHYVIS